MLRAEVSFEAIGTHWQIQTDQPVGADLASRISDRIETFDRTYSRFRADSLVTAIASAAGRYEFPDDAGVLFDLYDRLYRATDGAVTPLVGTSLEHLGYDRTYSLVPAAGHLPAPVWPEVMDFSDGFLTTSRPVLLDVGAAGKGYLVDILADLLDGSGITEYLIDGSGDLRQHGGQGHRIALEHPFAPGKAIGVANLSERALCGSATNRRTWGEGLHHVVDGRTGRPTSDVVATWVIAGTAVEADGLATGLFFAGPEAFGDFDFNYVRMFANGTADRSAHFDGELFT
ncbi:FAD:protein FMN transferase [Nakamurella silvestris]|nr:FAD:protein FMN transferase [Nakamurella silvestris]